MSVEEILKEASRGLRGDWLYHCDDFQETLNTGRWETVKDSSASAAISADAQNGVLLLSSAATTDNDGALVQSIQEFVKPSSGKRFALRAKVKVSDADQMDFFFGLSEQGATDPEAILAASNRLGFQINDGDASILCKSEASDLETSVDSQSDAADDTYLVLGLSYDGSGRVQFEINGNGVAVHTSNIPASELAVALFHLSGNNSGTKTSSWDYVEYAVER